MPLGLTGKMPVLRKMRGPEPAGCPRTSPARSTWPARKMNRPATAVTHLDAFIVAKEAGANRLVLCHFDPGKYPSMDHRKAAEDAAKAIFPETIAAADGTAIGLP